MYKKRFNWLNEYVFIFILRASLLVFMHIGNGLLKPTEPKISRKENDHYGNEEN